MSTLIVLCCAAFALVALLSSAVAQLALPWLDRLAPRIVPRHSVRIWLGLAALPSLIGLLAVGVSFLPALGIGHDHCLAHDPHHPHLCPYHLGAAPGLVVIFIALLLAARVAQVIIDFLQALLLSRRTSGTLTDVSEHQDGVLVFPGDEPKAFVLGTWHPRVHLSRGLFALERDIVAAVIAHERVHARHRDLLWRLVCPVLALGHWPATAVAIRTRLAAAQEMAADEEAAELLPGAGRLKLAAALVTLAKLAPTPAPTISFTHGDVQTRVRALLDTRRQHATWPGRLLLAALLLVPTLIGASHDFIHHGLETLLGALR